ncbi:helix-turn-helix domain-containing protein [Citrobacter sp. EC_71]|uniref:helix-turn-helix domain-containing protein n=1 Tax=Citrobacter sp. EC_71 TaxID=2584093 RepID=UPI001C7095D9|nr:helix-turn-helix domain-containing protein [Citrobacter sp. EC_71]
MTAAAPASNTGFVMLTNDLLNIEKIAGKVFTGNMKITYSLIQGFKRNGQTAYFSQSLLATQLGTSLRSVTRLLVEMVEMGLINKTGQIGGKTCHYTVNPITPEMLGTAEPEATPAALPEAPQEQPQQPAKAPEPVAESNPTAEPTGAPRVPEIVPIAAAAAPGPEAPITLMTVYSEKMEAVEQQTGEVVPVVVPFPRGEIKEPSKDWDLDPAF